MRLVGPTRALAATALGTGVLLGPLLLAGVGDAGPGPGIATPVVARTRGGATVELRRPHVRLSFDGSMRLISVPGTLPGAGEFVWHLDTGCSYDLALDRAVADELELELLGSVVAADASGRSTELPLVRVPELELDGLLLRDLRAVVADLGWIGAPGRGRLGGLLGFSLFEELVLQVDYPARSLSVRRGSLPAHGPGVVELTWNGGVPEAPLRVEGRTLHVTLDTGHTGGLALHPRDVAGLRTLYTPRDAGRGRSLLSHEAIDRTALRTALLGAEELTEVPVLVGELYGRPLMGSDALDELVLTFDSEHGRLRVVRPQATVLPLGWLGTAECTGRFHPGPGGDWLVAARDDGGLRLRRGDAEPIELHALSEVEFWVPGRPGVRAVFERGRFEVLDTLFWCEPGEETVEAWRVE